MDERDIVVGQQYAMPAGMVDVLVVQIDRVKNRVRLEQISGRQIGLCRWESIEYFCSLNARTL